MSTDVEPLALIAFRCNDVRCRVITFTGARSMPLNTCPVCNGMGAG